MDLAALTAEIAAGPLAAELAPLVATGADHLVAQVLNRRDRANVWRGDVTPDEIRAAIDPTEFGAMTAVPLQRLAALLAGAASFDCRRSAVRNLLDATFPQASLPLSRAAVRAVLVHTTSRAEEAGLVPPGGIVTADAVQQALRPTQAGHDDGANGEKLMLHPDATDQGRLRWALVTAAGDFLEWRGA